MKELINISADVLKVHPRNAEFFDDISGEEYERFKKSIGEDGILSPLLVSPDMMVISGHQRLKAAKELGIKLVPVIIREDLVDEDDKLKKLLVANFGRSKNDPVKQGKIYKEYESLCGVSVGRPNKLRNNFAITQEQIAKEFNIDVRTIQNLKRLTALPQELQDLISDGKITATTGYKLLTRLSEEEQQQLIESLDVTKKLTQREVQEYVDRIRELESKPPTIVDKTDYTMINKLKSDKEDLESKIKFLKKDKDILERRVELNQQDSDKYNELKSGIKQLQSQKNSLAKEIESALSISGLVVEVERLLKDKLAPIKYSKAIQDLPDNEILRDNLKEIVNRVDGWCDEMYKLINNNWEDIQ